MTQFRAAFKALAERKGKQGVYLRADARVVYGPGRSRAGVMKRAGAAGIGIVVEPENPR